MSNLSNLYISESYYGVVNLYDSTEPFASQSEAKINFTDGVGESLGLSVTDTKDIVVDNNLIVSTSVEVVGDISASSAQFSGDVNVTGTVRAYRVITTIESSSVIFSTGSNIIGDEITDTQTIVGQTTISGSLTVFGPHSHTGDLDVTGSLFVSNEISSSTLAGIGNVTLYSQSVDTRLDYLEGPFSTSVDSRLDALETDTGSQDQRLDSLELFTSSQETINSGYNTFTQSYYVDSSSFDQRIDELEQFSSSLVADFVSDVEYSASIAVVTGSLITQIDTKLDTGSYLIDSASFDTRINTKLDSSWTSSVFTPYSASAATTDLNQQNQINSLISVTGSYATTGSNTFSGSINGEVISLSVVSSTASMDCSNGNFFTLLLESGSITRIEASNIKSGQTISLKITQPSVGYGATVFSNSFKFISGSSYDPGVQSNTNDILTFISFDNSYLYGVFVNNFI